MRSEEGIMPGGEGHRGRVVIVERDPLIAGALRGLFGRMKYQVEATVESGLAAVEAVRQFAPDALVVSAGFAGKPGEWRDLAGMNMLPRVPAVMLLTDGDGVQAASTGEVSVDGLLLMPLAETQVSEALEVAFQKKGWPRPGGDYRPAPSVLVAGADASIRGLLTTVLDSAGYDVTEAMDEEEARQLVSTMRFDLVIFDRNGDSKEKLELAGKALGLAEPTRILVVSGSAPEKVTAVGNLVFLRKPFALPDLLGAIRRLVGQEP